VKTNYLPSFIKDLKALKSSPIFESVKNLVFEEIPNGESLDEIRSLKRLKGYTNAYRLRVSDYRIGIFIEAETIIFARILHRREIYRYFP
jgi:mRNA interferase RelE/StbE